MNGLFPLLQLGGWMMWPILACSLAALAIILERTWVLIVRAARIVPKGLAGEVEELVKKGDLEAALVCCRKNDSLLGRVLGAGLRQYGRPREVIREAIEDAGRREVSELDRFLGTLATLAVVSPMLGFLGTVIGMIQVFQQISSKGEYQALAGGIYVALLTTAAGLIVAIPSFLAHRTFSGLADRYSREMETISVHLLNRLEQTALRQVHSSGPAAGSSPPDDLPVAEKAVGSSP